MAIHREAIAPMFSTNDFTSSEASDRLRLTEPGRAFRDLAPIGPYRRAFSDMKILLIYPDINTIQFPHYQHGLAWISSVLKRGGHEVELLYLDKEISDEELVARVKSIDPEVAAFSSTTQQFSFTLRYARALKKATDKFIVIGGIHATIDPENVMASGAFDALVRGEGEYPLLELLEALGQGRDFSAIRNLWAANKSGELVRNDLRPPVDLAGLPWPDRELFDDGKLMLYNDRQVSMMASRGCPFNCTYCCNTVLASLVGGQAKWVRQRPLDDLMGEIGDVHARYPDIKSLIFMDEVFALKKKWILEFCEAYKAKFKTPFQIFLRVESVDRETLERMADAGLYSVIVGVESGNERIRREVLNRKMTNRKIIEVFGWADELGLETWDFNMIGVPGDTEETIRDTMELNRIIKPHHPQVSIFYPFPGTPIHDVCVEMGLAKVGENTSVFLSEPVLDLPTISRDRLRELHKEFMALSHQLEAEKTARGYADLTALFDKAEVRPGGPDYVATWRVRVAGEDRLSVLLHPPSSITYRVKVEPDSALRFGMAFSEDSWTKPGGGTTFIVKIKTRMRKEKVVFEETIDPKREASHRKWLDREVDLARFANKNALLTLETVAPGGDNQFCPAFWGRPRLERKKEG